LDRKRDASIVNLADMAWTEYPGHFGGALSKCLAGPDHGSAHFDYRVSCYAPGAYVARHKHAVQEQVYHVLEGEGLFEYGAESQVVRRHDVMFIPPGVEHAFRNTGTKSLVFVVVTTPIEDRRSRTGERPL
jgi:quercetin dioxygenase-like cupin family protein